MDCKHLEDVVESCTERRKARQEGVLGGECLASSVELTSLLWFCYVPSENDYSPSTIARQQLLEVPRSSVCNIEDFRAWYSLADHDTLC